MSGRSEDTSPFSLRPHERLRVLWQQGHRPDLGAFLNEAGPLPTEEAMAAVRVDQEQRWLLGAPVLAEEYLRRHRALFDGPDAAVELIHAEYLLRRQCGGLPTLEEYLRRFPEHASRLARKFPPEGASAPASTRLVSPWPLLPGAALGQYVLLRELGAGGMGQVFLARHRLMGRVVALKAIRPDGLHGEAAVQRFRREITAAGRLSHPNIVAAYDADEADGVPFLVMEFVEGTDLHRFVAEQGPLDVAHACDCVRQAALGLQHAHECGLVHRDIKPHNLLRTPQGQVKVLDLGLACLRQGGGDQLTLPGTVLGTPDYMAPEQARDAQAADIRADIYSLGCTLYFLLTGKPPFPGGGLAEKLLRHQADDAPPVEALRPEVPPALGALLRRLMARQPDRRPATPADVAGALLPFVPAGATAQPPPSNRPGPARLWLAVAGVAALLLLVGQLAWSPRPTPTPEDNTPPAIAPPKLNLAPRLLFDKAVSQKGGPRFVTFRPDGKLLAIGRKDGGVRLWNVETGTIRPLLFPRGTKLAGRPFEHLRPALFAAWSPDGKAMVTSDWQIGPGGGDAVVWDADTGALLHRIDPTTAPKFSPPLHRSLNLFSREPRTTRPLAVVFSPDSRLLAVGGLDRLTSLWDVQKGAQVANLWSTGGEPGRYYPTLAAAFSPGGERLATAVADHLVRVWDVGRREQFRELAGHSSPVAALAWSPKGGLLVSGCDGGAVKGWDVKGGRELFELRKKGPGVVALLFAPGGQALLALDAKGEIRAWDVASRRELARFRCPGEGKPCALSLLQGGKALAVARTDHVAVWALE